MTTATFKDRSLGLTVFGILEIAIGAFCALLIPLALMVTLASQRLGGGRDLRALAPSLAIYGLMAVAFISIGIGSIRARRWARAVMLSLARLWLITGVLTMVLFWVLVPRWIGVAGGVDLAADVASLVMLTTSLFVGFVYVLLPLAFVLFYRSDHVAATCRARDPGPSWVDDCPPQIVTLVLIYVVGGASLLVLPAYGFPFPLFGVILDGWAGGVAWLAVLVLLAVLIRGTARREPRAWTLAMAASLAAALSWTVHAALVPESIWLDRLALSPEERSLMMVLGEPTATVRVLLSLALWGGWIVYLASVRRHFDGAARRTDRRP